MLQERSAEVGGSELHMAEGPATGPPLVGLHGGSAGWHNWEALLECAEQLIWPTRASGKRT